MRRWVLLAIAAVMATALLAACGGSGEKTVKERTSAATATTTATARSQSDTRATATPTASARATATKEAASDKLACKAPSDVKTFRFTIVMKMDIPELREARGDHEGQGALGALMGALTDLEMQGAYVAPDRSEVRMKLGTDEMAVITIGDKQWTRIDKTGWTQSPASGEATPFSPATLCEEGFGDLDLGTLKGKEETVNGVKTLHYHLDKADMETLARLFGGLEEELQNMPDKFEADIWLAKDGNWPVKMNVKASGKDEQKRDFSVEVRMEVKDLNDSSIKIEPPS